MGGFLTDDIERLRPASGAMFPSPIPTQVIAGHEFWPIPKTERQKRVEARITDFAGELAARQSVPRRRFLQTAAGMAAAFVAMNDVHRPIFGVSSAEANEPERAEARAA